jgi:hypothetical protein
MDLPDILVIIGLVLMLAGAAWLLLAPSAQPPPPPAGGAGRPEALPDIGAWIKAVKELLEAFESRVRQGVFVVIVGLVLVGLGVWLDVRETEENVAEQTSAVPMLVISTRI